MPTTQQDNARTHCTAAMSHPLRIHFERTRSAPARAHHPHRQRLDSMKTARRSGALQSSPWPKCHPPGNRVVMSVQSGNAPEYQRKFLQSQMARGICWRSTRTRSCLVGNGVVITLLSSKYVSGTIIRMIEFSHPHIPVRMFHFIVFIISYLSA